MLPRYRTLMESVNGLITRSEGTRETWKFGIVLYNNLTTLDIQGPMELLGWLRKGSGSQTNPLWPFVPYEFDFDYIAESLNPVATLAGPWLLPTKTFSEVKDTQYDIILVPGAESRVVAAVSPTIIDFVKEQNPGLRYLLSVCTGAWIVAKAGVLEGKNATTNKAAFKRIKNETSTNINWIPKARWVVDGNTWTSSGVSAGGDMAHAFMEHLVGDNFTTVARNIVEWRAAEQGDDPFAHEWGLV
ncbi:class I glutamine amidotransferase-like protein [Rhizoctonia solani]|nr:class I glutamine amidotransferase-like protein [Rhizoctonia solani]